VSDYRIESTSEADAHAREIDSWWRDHRPAAPDLFLNELTRSFMLLARGHTFTTASTQLPASWWFARSGTRPADPVRSGRGDGAVVIKDRLGNQPPQPGVVRRIHPELALSVAPENLPWRRSRILRGLKRLPVTFTVPASVKKK
jgi:hypothetical protein